MRSPRSAPPIIAGEHHLALAVERTQQLALPAVPDAGADAADIADRQHQKEAQALDGLHVFGESGDGARIGDIAALRGLRHHEMVLDQPDHGLGFLRAQAEARAELARNAGAHDLMGLLAPLADIVQEQRDIERTAVLDRLGIRLCESG